jgi:hypothetical protein
MRNKRVLWITQTAVFIALLLVVQFVTRSFGQYVTGSLVNLILVTAALTAGLASGLTVAVLSPFFAFLFGIGPVIQIVPFIALGNGALVLVCWLVLGNAENPGIPRRALAVVAGSFAKLLVLWLGVVKVMLPLMTNLQPKQVETMTAMFTWPQLATALIGSSIAMIVVPLVKRALKKGA